MGFDDDNHDEKEESKTKKLNRVAVPATKNAQPCRLRQPGLKGIMRWILFFCCGLVASMAWASPLPEFTIPENTRQLIVGVAPDWDSTEVTLQRFERNGPQWKPVGSAFPARLGKSGMAWGIGLHSRPSANLKVEGDGRAPAGAFALGGAYGYEPNVARRPSLPYHQVTELDLWVEDVKSPHYNRHLRLKQPPQNQWEREQQMRLNDNAHKLKLFIKHNAGEQTEPNMGSSIFFHIWRENGGRPSFGCTTMSEEELRQLIRWVDPQANPVYVLLPKAVYEQARSAWKLP
jgi:L,D-peptidoglycan transpeptidase YkuD (ErfK/YbiS/YcfS/YnhG family)